uniref:Secreted protein n=1 Tax=Setaria viridis TaxID=4556 RepID=A0A4U6U283_SETVI|nr:hypothetical protein SEVIR_6G112880v2 [Setaria viridis]
MWQPCRLGYFGRQSLALWFLLANSGSRRKGARLKVQRVSILLQAPTPSSSGPVQHPTILAFHMLGAGHGRILQDCSGWLHTHLRGSRQIHQVD